MSPRQTRVFLLYEFINPRMKGLTQAAEQRHSFDRHRELLDHDAHVVLVGEFFIFIELVNNFAGCIKRT